MLKFVQTINLNMSVKKILLQNKWNFSKGFCSVISSFLEEKKVKIGKHNINYLKVGHGPHAVILTPGGLGTIWTNYRAQIEGFNRDNFTLIVWDPPGFGKSYPPKREFTRESYENDADTAHKLMEILEIPRYSVLGWSAGGSASLIQAAKYPDAVKKLVVWSTSACIYPQEIQAFMDLRDISRWNRGLREAMIETYGKDRFAVYWAEWVDDMTMMFRKNSNICTEKLKYIQCPTFILHGRKDPLIDPIHLSHMKERIQNCLTHFYEDGKHEIHIRYKEDFNRRVQEFLLLPN